MPRGDRTGPRGMGSMTGRAAGNCAGFGMPGYTNPTAGGGVGRGFGMGRSFGGRGGGRGRRNWFGAGGFPAGTGFGGQAAPYQESDPATEKQVLKNQAGSLQAELDLIQKRLSEIETGTAEE